MAAWLESQMDSPRLGRRGILFVASIFVFFPLADSREEYRSVKSFLRKDGSEVVRASGTLGLRVKVSSGCGSFWEVKDRRGM